MLYTIYILCFNYMQSFDDNEMEIVTEDEVETPLGGDLNNPEKKAMKLYVFFLLLFQTLFRISDTALSILLLLMFKFIRILGALFNCEQLLKFAEKLPTSVKNARLSAGSVRGNFQKCSCCRKCFSIYPWNPTVEPQILTCTYVKYPNHTQAHFRQPCGEKLCRKVKTLTGKEINRPFSVYHVLLQEYNTISSKNFCCVHKCTIFQNVNAKCLYLRQ